MRLFALLFIALALSACSAGQSNAIMSRVYPQGIERINVEVWKATNEWRFNPHGGFGNIVEYYGFTIPKFPTSRVVFAAKEIAIKEIISLEKDVPPIEGSEITVDPIRREVVVALKTSKGEFPGNGTYQLSVFSP